MTAHHQLTETATPARGRWRSVGAVVLGFVVLAALALGAAPVLHALAPGVVRVVRSSAGAAGGMMKQLGPNWYPIAIAVTALPCAWLGELLHRDRRGR
jgi:hypothetical protein